MCSSVVTPLQQAGLKTRGGRRTTGLSYILGCAFVIKPAVEISLPGSCQHARLRPMLSSRRRPAQTGCRTGAKSPQARGGSHDPPLACGLVWLKSRNEPVCMLARKAADLVLHVDPVTAIHPGRYQGGATCPVVAGIVAHE